MLEVHALPWGYIYSWIAQGVSGRPQHACHRGERLPASRPPFGADETPGTASPCVN